MTVDNSINYILKVENIVKSFGDYKAVNDVSFQVEKQKVFGLLGPNGAGKTTTIRMINNILIPDTGIITIFGEKLSEDSQNRMGYLPEERGLYKKIKVLEQLIYFGQLKGMKRFEASQQAKKWLKQLDAAEWENKKIQELSKGMQQKVQFISTILHDPDLIILDEPFSGFDPINTETLKQIILDLKNEGKTIILSTHVMQQVEQLCDDICLINKGRAVLQGAVRDIKRSRGRDTILLEYEGEDTFLNELRNVRFLNRSNGRVEFRMENAQENSNEILELAMKSVNVFRFELIEPSLHEIFIETVSSDKGEELQ